VNSSIKGRRGVQAGWEREIRRRGGEERRGETGLWLTWVDILDGVHY